MSIRSLHHVGPSIRSNSFASRTRTRTIQFGSGSGPSIREYHGDPGPSSLSVRHERRRQFRQDAVMNDGKGKIAKKADMNILNQMLDSTITSSITPRARTRTRTFDGQGQILGDGRESRSPRASVKSLTNRSSSNTRQRTAQRTTTSSLESDTPRPDSFRHRTQGPLATHDDNPYTTSTRLRRWIEKHPSNINSSQTEEVIKLVCDAPKHMVNAVVWNSLLGYMGRLGKLDLMWKLFNDMKKRGVKPTSRTYSTVLNAYAQVAHNGDNMDFTTRQPEQRTLSRVTILFEQTQAHIQQCQANLPRASVHLRTGAEAGVEEGNSDSVGVGDIEADALIKSEIDIAPTNAYLKYLARHGLWEEMQRVFVSLDQSGYLAPDVVTYTTMFAGLYHVNRARERERKAGPGTGTGASEGNEPVLAIGPIAMGLWDQCVRQLGTVSEFQKDSKAYKIDNILFTHALRCLLHGRPKDQRLAIALTHHIWGLSVPGQASIKPFSSSSSSSSDTVQDSMEIPNSMQEGLTRLSIDIKSATSLISMLNINRKPTLATHFTHLFLSDTSLHNQFDIYFFRAAIHALSETGDINTISDILDSYSPPDGSGWGKSIWTDALLSCRKSGDFISALSIFRLATHLEQGVEFTKPGEKSQPKFEEYKWEPPNELKKSKRYLRKPPAVEPDAFMISTLIRTAMGKGKNEIGQALAIYNYLKENGRIKLAEQRSSGDNRQVVILEQTIKLAKERMS